jgi:chromosome segregation ATPase
MKLKRIYRSRKFVWLIFLTAFMSYCTSPDTKKEAQKVIDKQVEVLDKEQKVTEDLYKKVRDSLQKQETKLLSQKGNVEQRITEFEQTKKQEKVSDLQEQKLKLNNELKAIEDSLNVLKNELKTLASKQAELEIKEDQLKEQKEQAKDTMVTGIEEIDQRLDKIEEQKITKQKEIDINQKKIDLAKQKIDLLKEEKNIYERKKNDLIIEKAENDEIERIGNKIADVEEEIGNENDKIEKAKKAISTHNQWLVEFTTLKNRLNEMMAKKFNRKQTIDSFTMDEIKRLNNEKLMLKEENNELIDAQQKLVKQKNKINKDRDLIDNELTIVSSSELSNLFEQKMQLDREEASLSGQEVELKKSTDAEEKIASKANNESSLTILEELEKDVKKRRDEIESIKYELATNRQELAEKQAEINTIKAKKASAAKFVGLLVIIGLLALAGLFYLGKRKRLKKTNK